MAKLFVRRIAKRFRPRRLNPIAARTSKVARDRGQKRVVFVQVHPWPETMVANWENHWFRERHLVQQTKDLGYDAKHYILWMGNHVHAPSDGSVVFFPVDDPALERANAHTSKPLLAAVKNDAPDLILMKGMGYNACGWLLRKTNFQYPFAFIIGGGVKDKNKLRASFILAEFPEQIEQHFQLHQQADRVRVLPKAIDTGLFKPSASKKFDVINVGAFIDRKNQAALIPLVEKYRVALIGDGPNYEKTRKIVEGINPSTYMPGHVPKAQIPQLMSQARLMVHPATREGFPRVIMESLACGVPVVALSRTIRGLLRSGVHGLLVEEKDLCAVSTMLLENQSTIDYLSDNARRLVSAEYNVESTIRVLQDMYDTVL